MTKPALVLIHGRSQGGRDPGELRRIWLDAFRDGLGANAESILDGVEVRFPYYGDALDAWIARADGRASGTPRGDGDTLTGDPQLLEFQSRVAVEILARHGIDAQAEAARLGGSGHTAPAPRSPEWVQAIFRILDRLPGATGAFISAVMRDVHLYLNNPGARRDVDAIVTPEIRGRCIVVAHSLGSVVAYRLLKAATDCEVPLFLTIGSPLGIGPIRESVTPRRFPAVVKTWTNAFDDRDDVALYPLGRGRFPVEPQHPIEDISGIDNRTENHHGIVEYLNKPIIAKTIATALET
ncbi:hypothetical protein [Methylorubrum thiocyanatum]